jgi:hypothetical protein
MYLNVLLLIQIEGAFMGLPKTVRFDEELEKEIEHYLKKNEIKFSQLVNMAVSKFIMEPQMIQLAPVDNKDFLATAKKAFHKHKDARVKFFSS